MKYIFIFMFLVLAASAGAVQVRDDNGMYTHTDYPASQFNLPQPQHLASEAARDEWRDQRFGLFIHWGIYSVLEGMWKGEQIPDLGEQIQRHAKIPGREYVEVAKQFNPVKFDAREYARLARAAGMNYIIITSKHHDGFAMWDSKFTDFDIMDASPCKKDIIKMLADACAEEGIKFGVYYSNPDWHHNNHTMNDTSFSVNERFDDAYMTFSKNQLTELLTHYGLMLEIFFDMGKPTVEQSAAWAKTVRDLQPNCLVSGRVMNRQGDFYTMSDNGEPATPIDTPWEVPCTFTAKPGHTWGYKSWVKRPPMDVEVKKRIGQLSRVASRGGNYLLNIGPLPDGTILPYHKEALLKIGEWAKIHEEAIYHARPTPFQVMPWGEATHGDGKLYLHVSRWPKGGKLVVADLLTPVKRVHWLPSPEKELKFKKLKSGIEISLPKKPLDKNLTILALELDGEVRARTPIATVKDPKHIVLDKTSRRTEEFYTGLAYHSRIRNVRATWDFPVAKAGIYRMKLTAGKRVTKKRPKQWKKDHYPVVITAGGKQFRFNLPMDGAGSVVELGAVELAPAGRASLVATTDLDVFRAEGIELKPHHAGMLVDIERVELIRE